MGLDPEGLQDADLVDISIGIFFKIPHNDVEKSIFQWMKLLHALDQPGLPGWPLVTSNVPLQKCDKCPQHFCSDMNHKRHFHVEHKSKKRDKEPANTRRLALGELWDGELSVEEKTRVLSFEEIQLKVSVEEAKMFLSFEEAQLGIIKGSIVLDLVSNLIWHTAFPPLTRDCLRAGFYLLYLLQGEWLPNSSEELFSKLDDASESTFLCGEAASMEGTVFGTSIMSAMTRTTVNLIAMISFLVEKRLVEAQSDHSKVIAEALQKSLIEDEAAAKKRKAKKAEKNKKKKEKRKEKNAKKQTVQKEASSSLSPADLDAKPDEVLSASGSSSDNSSDDDPFIARSSSLPLVIRDAVPPEFQSSHADGSGSLAPSDREPMPHEILSSPSSLVLPERGSMPHEVQSSPAETSSSFVPPERGSMTDEDLLYLAKEFSSFHMYDWGSEPAEDPERDWHEVVRGRQKTPARSRYGISIGSQAGQKYLPSKSGGHFDVSFRSQTRPNKGNAGHSEDPGRRMVQGREVWHTGSGLQQAPARSQSGISRGFHGDQSYHPLIFGGMSKNVAITERTAPLGSRKVREMEWRENQKPANDAATEQPKTVKANKQKPEKEERLIAKADAATEHSIQEEVKNQKPANDEESLNAGTPLESYVRQVTRSCLDADQASSSEVGSTSLPLEAYVYQALRSSLGLDADRASSSEVGSTSLPLETYVYPVDRFLFSIKLVKDLLAERWRAALEGDHEFYEPSLDSEVPSNSAAGVEPSKPPKGETGTSETSVRGASGQTADKFRTRSKKGTKLV